MADNMPPTLPPTPPAPPTNNPPTDDTDAGTDVFTNWVRWKCLVCGYVYEGEQAPNAIVECPRCHNKDPDKFADVD